MSFQAECLLSCQFQGGLYPKSCCEYQASALSKGGQRGSRLVTKPPPDHRSKRQQAVDEMRVDFWGESNWNEQEEVGEGSLQSGGQGLAAQGLQAEFSAKGLSCLVTLLSPPSHWDETQDPHLFGSSSKVRQMKPPHGSVTKGWTAGWDTRTSTLPAGSERKEEPEPLSPLLERGA